VRGRAVPVRGPQEAGIDTLGLSLDAGERCLDHPLRGECLSMVGYRSVVMESLQDYQELEETSYLLRSPVNAKRLIESIPQLESGKGIEHELSL